jgi:hypothetical protein
MKYKYKSPEGEAFTIEARSQDEADELLMSHVARDMQIPAAQRKAETHAPVKVAPMNVDPAEGMNVWEKGMVGMGGGARNAYLGAKNFVGLGTDEEREERKFWNKSKEHLGAAGTVGEAVGEGVATLPIGGAVGMGAKVLTKALPWALRVGNVGGRVANLGTLGRAATEGAASAGVVGNAEDDDRNARDRGDDAIEGAGMGTVGALATGGLGKVLGKASNLVGGAYRAITPKSSAQRHAAEAMYKELENEGVNETARLIRYAPPSMLPQSTAAITGSQRLSALERGGRNRGNEDWTSHDENVLRSAWNELTNTPIGHQSQAGDVLKETFMRNGVVVTPKVVGRDISFEVPHLESHPLRQALGKLQPGLTQVEMDRGKQIANELAKHEAAATGPGRATPESGGMSSLISNGLAIASAAKGSPTLWKIRSAFNTVAGQSNKETNKAIDAALLDPNKFMDLVQIIQTKIDTGRPLSHGEEVLHQILLGTSRQAAVESTPKVQ